ncbi:manganese transport protein MntH [Klebsiella pneumoniae]|uniref:Manganese transport protein MntH n=2 Tax=Enterobacteriaceae TaxID=543 RepID=A0A378BLS1_KLEPN|nr:manganese transport protein MntH [Klebsiella pneumoniae]
MTSSRVENSSSRAARKVKLALMGPAFVAAIGYIDPGNFATNIQAGASFGYQLLWVVVWANLMAMLIQVLSAKLGIATGKNLAEQIRDHYPRPVVWFYWVQAEIIAMATDLAEFIGAAIGFKLVLGVSLLQGAVLTGVATFLILMLQRRGQKPLEKVIGGLLLFVAVAYVVELIFSQPALAPLTKGLVIPTLPNGEAVFLAAGVLGATIMPHVIYLHSSLTQHLHGGTRKERYNATRWDVAIAMTIAGFVNLAMMATAAAAFHFNGHTGVADLDQAYMTLEPLLSHAAATIFGLSLIAAGLSSTGGGHFGRSGRYAGVYPLSYSAVVSPGDHHAAVVCRHSAGAGSYAHPGNESGVAQLWHCACPGAAADIYQQCEADGGPGEYPLGERHRLGDSRYCGEPERLVNSGVAARGGLIDS